MFYKAKQRIFILIENEVQDKLTTRKKIGFLFEISKFEQKQLYKNLFKNKSVAEVCTKYIKTTGV